MVALGFILSSSFVGFSKPIFNSSALEGQDSEVFFCDLNGDGLSDAVLLGRTNISISYQNSTEGFSRKQRQEFPLDNRPRVIWPAKLGKKTESLLAMTSGGVTEFSFTNPAQPPSREQIIQQETIIPETNNSRLAWYFPLSAKTGTDWPLLLVPIEGGIEVWRHGDQWEPAQLLEGAVETHLHPSLSDPGYGYSQSLDLNLSLGDLNGDARDDLIVMQNDRAGLQIFSVYLQTTDSKFQRALTYTNKADWHVGLAWTDLNHDGKPDLIKSSFLDEPFFIPGMRSGKVVVGAHLADAQGNIPSQPQYIFRKNDWSQAIPVVDIDGDGFVDMVMGHIPINTREGFRKAVTAQEIDLALKFYFFRPGAGYAQNPDLERDVALHFHRDPHEFFFTQDRRLYYEQFVSLNGDFNGDGKKDLLVRDRKSEISVYFFLSREKGFSREADLRFHCPEAIEWWRVEDLNGDGASDLIVKLGDKDMFRIFTSRTK